MYPLSRLGWFISWSNDTEYEDGDAQEAILSLPVTTNLILHLDASAISGLSDNDAVAQWNDLSGEDNHATQSEADNRPTYKVGVVNGRAAVRVAATNEALDLPDLSIGASTPYTAFLVLKATIPTANRVWFTSGAARHGFRDNGGEISLVAQPSSARLPFVITGWSDTDPNLITVHRSGDVQPTLRLGGVDQATSGSTVRFWGAHDDYIGVYAGDYCECLVYSRELTEPEIEQVEHYLGAKWLDWARVEADAATSVDSDSATANATVLGDDGESLEGRFRWIQADNIVWATRWRLFCHDNHGDPTYLQLRDVRFYANGFSIAKGQQYDRSSQHSTWGPERAFDEDTGTGWASESGNVTDQWVEVEFPSDVFVSRLAILGYDHAQAARNFTLQAWDGASWVNVINGETQRSGDLEYWDVTNWTETPWDDNGGTYYSTDDSFSASLTGLDSDTEYAYQAQVRYDEGGGSYVESPWSNIIYFSTTVGEGHCAWCMALFDVSITVQEVTVKDVDAGNWPILWQDVSTGITASAIPKGWWTEIRDSDENILCIPRWPQIELELLANEPHRLTLTLPGDSPCAEYMVKGNELWLRKEGALIDKFLFTHRRDMRNDSGMWAIARCLQLMDQLADELVTGTYSAADDDVTTILTALLAYQRRTPVISLVEVSPALDVNRTLDVKWMTILQAIQRVRDTVGGYLYVDTDRGLHLVESLGSDTGQQVRYRKNLKGIESSTDYVPLCTELYVLGAGEGATQLDLEDVIITDEEATQSEDATHGYLTLGGEFSAYEGFTGDGNALPAHITVWEYPGPVNVTADWLQHTDHSVKAALVDYDNSKTYTLNYNHAGYLQNAAAIAAHGVIAKVVANKEISEAESLIAWARVLFRQVSVPMATYEIDMVNLEQRLAFEQLALGNTVTVIDEDLGIDIAADVVRIYWSDYMRLEDMEITLSNRARDIADYFSSLQGTQQAFNYYEQT